MKRTFIAVLITVFVLFSMGSISRRYNPVTALAYYAVDTASDDNYLAQIDGIGGYEAGLFILLNPANDNLGECTLNINGLGAQSLKTALAVDPVSNHIDAAQIVSLCYDGTNFVIMTGDSNP